MTSTAEQQPQQQQDDEEQLMLQRLQSQFGDMDLTNLLNGEATTGNGDVESEESSAADPSPEELRAWQEAQFQKGQAQLAAKRDATKSAVQRRREELQQQQQQAQADDEDDWEQVPALPQLQGASVFFPSCQKGVEILGVHPLLQQLCTQGDAPDILGTKWQCLYSSAIQGDGLSFATLVSKLEGYPGPTVILISAVPSKSKALNQSGTNSSAPTTIGFFTTSPWIDNATNMTGSSDCFLFAFNESNTEDTVHFFRPKKQQQSNNNNSQQQHYMYCHSSSATPNRPKSMTDIYGLGVGGTGPSQLRLYLTESLEECRALDYCPLFEPGDLLLGTCQDISLNYFDVAALEVWAVGGDEWIAESKQRQAKVQGIAEANRIKARQVDKQRVWKECFQPQSGLLSSGGASSLLAGAQDARCDV